MLGSYGRPFFSRGWKCSRHLLPSAHLLVGGNDGRRMRTVQTHGKVRCSLTHNTHRLSSRRIEWTGLEKVIDSSRRNYSGGKPNKNLKDGRGRFMSRLGMVTGLGTILLAKGKYVLTALKLTKATPLVSMILTSATYSLFFGVPYAVGMVGLIFVHECGHAIVMHHYGIKMSPMVFVPFVGAVISMKSTPQTVEHEAMIAFGGPVLGSAAALGVAGLAVLRDSQLLFALADFGLMINLFNLLPIGSLDGGRIANAISPLVSVGGLGLGGFMIYNGLVQNPIFYLIMLGGAYSTGAKLLGYDQMHEGYYKIPLKKRASIFAAYLSLIAVLLYAMNRNNMRRKTPRQLRAEQDGFILDDSYNSSTGTKYDDFFEDFESKNFDNDSRWK